MGGRVDGGCTTEIVDPSSIPGRVKTETTKSGIHNFLA